MNENKKKLMAILNWRVVYHGFSGIIFIGAGIFIFFWSKGLSRVINVKLFGLLLFAYGVYRIIVFTKLWQKAKAGLL